MPRGTDDFLYKAERLPGRFKVWQHGPAALPALLRAQTFSAVKSMRRVERGAPDHVYNHPDFMRMLTESVVEASDIQARLVSWARKWAFDRELIDLRWDHPHVQDALDRARVVAPIQFLANAVKAGRYRVQAKGGGHFRLNVDRRYVENACYGKQLEWQVPVEGSVSAELPAMINSYFRRTANSHPALVLDSMPHEIRLGMLQERRSIGMPRLLPASTKIGDLSLGVALEIHARLGMFVSMAERVSALRNSPETAILSTTLEVLTRELAKQPDGDEPFRVTPDEVASFVDLMSLPQVGEADPRHTPIIPWHGWAFVSPLSMFNSPEVQILRALSQDPAKFGRAGTALGKRDDDWLARWKSVPGIDVRARVKVKREDGSTAGDLDVVAVDLKSKQGVVMEVKSPLPPLRQADLASTDGLLKKASSQAIELKKKLDDRTVIADFPDGWPPYGDVNWTWLIGHPNEFDPGGEEHGTAFAIVSPLQFDSLGACASLADALNRLVSREIEKGLDYEVIRSGTEMANLRVEFEIVRVFHGSARGRGASIPSRYPIIGRE
jgi:hypothetical protein